MNDVFQEIKKFSGHFSGTGTNHEGQKFVGQFELRELFEGKGFQIKFTAHAQDVPTNTFHLEYSTIAPSPTGGISLFNFNTNTPFLTEHPLAKSEIKEGHTELVFRFGETTNKNSFREEVRLDLLKDGRIGYHYSWGLPGGNFEYRSGVIMEKQTGQ